MKPKMFFQHVGKRFGCDEKRADAVAFAVFQELRDRLTPKEAADVSAQLSPGLRRLWQEGERAARDVRRTTATEFVGRVGRRLSLADDREALRAVEAVFAALQRLLGSSTGLEGEAWDILSQLPKGVKKLWLEAGERREAS